MHGQSAYTPTKQEQLKSLLEACYPAWSKSHSWASPERFFIDCMAGSGHDKQGCEGSPLIFQNFAKRFDHGLCAWCDIEQKHTDQLVMHANDTCTTVLTGRYQVEVLNYLSSHVPINAMGLVYLDDNGCKQIWNDDGFLVFLMNNYPYLDVAVHFSEQAWTRSDGAGIEWAEKTTVTDVLQMILRHKPASVVYAPHIKQHWRLVYGVRSGKMDLRGQRRIKLSDYIETRQQSQMMLLTLEDA